MTWELVRALLLISVGFLIVILVSILRELYRSGNQGIREVRENGGGWKQFWNGVLIGSNRYASTLCANGVHASVSRDGVVRLEEKSSMSGRESQA
jgi:hypothetical protein